MPTHAIRIVVAVAVALLPLACGSSPAATTATVTAPASSPVPAGVSSTTVEIRTFRFQPTSLVVAPGAEVIWTNQDQIKHTVTAGRRGQPTNAFDTDVDGVGSTARFTFTA